jgi:exonuclease SbcC
MDKLRKDLKKLKDLKKEEKALSLRGADLDTLKRLFTGSGFVNYVSSVHLNNLCVAANDRFHKLTGQTLSLEMTENNNFQIRDYMNGGNVRSVKTLSGGQTFQASLALALALTDSIQTFNNSKQNFFFLDEGFGSLDKDALSVVFEALKSLKKENRVVGVISHVEELQQEMGVFVKVVNNAERGSELTFSWD